MHGRKNIKSTIFVKNVLNTEISVWFCLQLPSETFLILRRSQRDIINIHNLSRKIPVVLVRF